MKNIISFLLISHHLRQAWYILEIIVDKAHVQVIQNDPKRVYRGIK
ncbi:unnamed protein product [Paramecium sonneborni]|uniref:Uncharacterized protein n=1 Tax=Paramecium sonneborni TaxID=65129 RepID=A0A8S1NWF1_9CILI|nr:unnamed protein product [Paramecium sonneborni]